MEKEVIQIGNSLAVIIPSPVARAAGIKKGDYLDIENKKEKILVVPVASLRPITLKGIVPSKGASQKDFVQTRKTLSKSFRRKWKTF